jgi:hypothetical protein
MGISVNLYHYFVETLFSFSGTLPCIRRDIKIRFWKAEDRFIIIRFRLQADRQATSHGGLWR